MRAHRSRTLVLGSSKEVVVDERESLNAKCFDGVIGSFTSREGGEGGRGISDGGVDISRVVIGKQGKGPIERERQRDEKESEEEART